MPRSARARRGGTAVLAALALSGAAACSSAPRPAALAQDAGASDAPTAAASAGPVATAAAGAAAAPGAGTTVTRADGSKVTTITRADGTKVTVVTTKDGRTSTTTSKPRTSGTVAAPARSTLFTPAEDTIGITKDQITLCAHAALTYGAAFNTTDADFNVYWSALNDAGGIHGRKVVATYENDNYTAQDAVVAARACKAKNPFILLGGIGYDQIPAVRNYVEEQHILYLHHTATLQGSRGQKYSFSELPTVERMGEGYAQLVAAKYRGKKIGIIGRDSPTWKPGVDSFKAGLAKLGMKVVSEAKTVVNQGNYTNEILQMKNAGAEVVFGWENALSATQIIKQGKAQAYSPQWLVFGVNLMSQTLGDDALNPPLVGAVMYTPYSYRDYSGPFAQYADDMKEFERQYAKYRPDADLSGVGGDLLFLNWTAQKTLAKQLQMCGPSCTRNRFVDVLTSYNAVPTSSVCRVDFVHSDGYHGSQEINWIEAYRSPSGKANFRMMKPCVGP